MEATQAANSRTSISKTRSKVADLILSLAGYQCCHTPRYCFFSFYVQSIQDHIWYGSVPPISSTKTHYRAPHCCRFAPWSRLSASISSRDRLPPDNVGAGELIILVFILFVEAFTLLFPWTRIDAAAVAGERTWPSDGGIAEINEDDS